MAKATYGFDAYGNELTAPKKYAILHKGSDLIKTDIVFDVYAGWLCKKFHPVHTRYAENNGRWTTWARII